MLTTITIAFSIIVLITIMWLGLMVFSIGVINKMIDNVKIKNKNITES